MRRVTVLLVVLALTVLVAASVEAAPRKSAIDMGADRVVALQRTDPWGSGTWYWYIDNTYNATNLTGVTALGLLEAYRDSKTDGYMEAAKKAADFSMAHLGVGATETKYHVRMPGADIVFLFRLAQVTGDDRYSSRAIQEWVNIKTFWSTANALVTYFGGRQMGAWDLATYMQAAKFAGDNTWADQAAEILANTSHPLYYSTSNPYLALNAAGALEGLIGAGYAGTYASSVSSLLSMLVGTISGDNIGGYIQDTAYGVIALQAVGGSARAYGNAMAKWLASQQQASGGWLEDGLEYPEVDSEAVRAIASTVGTNLTVDGFESGSTANSGWRADATRGVARHFDTE